MTSVDRPNPDALLKAIQRSEQRLKKGRLKVFLGMAAGVGKTYAMLQAAQILKKKDLDILVGCVCTHGRKETAQLLEGLPLLPEMEVEYKGKVFHELDLEGVLRLKPQLVLVDELAHTNIPGTRHPKRWQDVKEILEAGIDVYTTLNVQHIESLKDIVETIAGVPIRETVPDSIIEEAEDIELVDLTPQALLGRLRDGKVYLGDMPEIAAQHFFQEDRLAALREIILRYAAEKIDRDLSSFLTTSNRPEHWKPRERLLVAISEKVQSQKLIRTTRRMASRIHSPWYAVYVDDGSILSEEEQKNLGKNLTLVRDLGGEVVATNDPDIAEGITRTARQKGITQIILGRRTHPWFFNFFRVQSILDRLIMSCSDVDIHVVALEADLKKYRRKLIAFSYPKEFYSYLWATIFVLLLALANAVILPYASYRIVGIVFLIGILLMSLLFRKGPILMASFLCVLIWGFAFVPPVFQFHVFSDEDIALMLLYLATGVATGVLVDRDREYKRMLAKREESAQVLSDIGRLLMQAPHIAEALKSVQHKLERLYPGSFAIVPKKQDGKLHLEEEDLLEGDQKEKVCAIWVFENGKEAGWSTDTLPYSQNLYIPLREFDEIVGVLIYRPKEKYSISTDEKNFLYTIAGHLANYVEKKITEERAKIAKRNEQIKEIHTSILNRISFVFQQPLLISQNAIKKLKEVKEVQESRAILAQLGMVEKSLDQLIEILANISALVKLNAGLVTMDKNWHSIESLIQVASDHLKKEAADHKMILCIPMGLPKIHVDFSLIEIVLLNLITNAVYYSPLGSKIEIEAAESEEYIRISISDEGKSIPEDQIHSIFDAFYQLPNPESRGIGLGLQAAKSIIELHDGYIQVENNPVKGTKFSVFLPK